MANLIKFEWYNDTDLGDVLYQFGYKNRMYLNIEIEKPEYNVTIEAEQNGDNQEITKFRKWEKVRKFEIFMQEDLVDAFTFMSLHDNIEVTLRTGEVLTVAKHSMRVDPSWEELGCLAKCEVSFVVDYVTAGSCNENMDSGCLCANIAGIFSEIEEFAHLGPAADGDIQLAWSVEDIAGKKYTADRYQYSVIGGLTWTKLATEANSCYTNSDDATTWIFDGQFWQLVPGYLITATLAGGDITITGWILPGAFCSVWYYTGAIWKTPGDYTAEELDTGITFTPAPAGTHIRLRVWNHSCDYDMTEQLAVT